MPVFNGYDGYILYFPDVEEENKEGIIDIVSRNYVIDLANLNKELEYVLDIIPGYSVTSELIWDVLPDFTTMEYNTYTRMPFSANSNTKKICIPLNEESYRTWYTDIPNVYQCLEDSK